ncbi:MAG: ABC transporter ATP-binding protein [Firmicutes bacterium]|nr:ABC transporter ATP-binding protein [Bacillota bacterium]
MKDMLKFVDKKKIVLVFLISIIQSIAVYAVSFCFSYFATSPLTIDKLQSLLISLVIIYSISLVIKWFFIHYSQNALYKIEYDAKNYFYKKLQTLEPQNLTKYHSGYIQSIIERSSQDYAVIIENIVYDFIPLIVSLISFVYMACTQSLLLGIICIIIFTFAFIIRISMQRARRKTRKAESIAMSSYNGALIDFIQNIFTVIKLNAEDFTNKRLVDKENKVLKELQINENKTANIHVVFNFFTYLVYIIVVIFCIIMAKNGEDALPYLVFYMSIIGSVADNLGTCSKKVETIFSFQVNKKQLDEVIGNKEKIEDNNKWKEITIKDGEFSYKDRSRIIRIPDFKINKGDKISVMGESGQGKTTILNILSGTYPLNNGIMSFDNKPSKHRRPDVVYISQDVELFDMSIRDNLTLGKNIKENKLLEMFEEAGLMDWYNSLENGLDEIVGEKGVKLSAGQRQRLNIIRGILINKDVYFFDEPTSALDKESEERIVNMIDKYLNDKTYIIVTHRESIKRLCNRHYIFENHTMTEIK